MEQNATAEDTAAGVAVGKSARMQLEGKRLD